MVDAPLSIPAPRCLCRSGGRFYVLVLAPPCLGDLVAVSGDSAPHVEQYYGQPCLGVLYPAGPEWFRRRSRLSAWILCGLLLLLPVRLARPADAPPPTPPVAGRSFEAG